MGIRKISVRIYIVLGFLLPYTFIGYNSSNMIMLLMGMVVLLMNKSIKVNKNIVCLLGSLGGYALLQTIVFSREINSFAGLSLYLTLIVGYLIFSNVDDDREGIIKTYIYTVAISIAISIIYQGIILDRRIDGNIGYANTYAILILLGIHFNKFLENRIVKRIVNILFMVGMLFTGSRTTIILLIILLIFRAIKDKNNNILYESCIAVMIYIILDLYVAIALFIMPIIIYGVTLELNKKTKKIFSILMIIGILGGSVFLSTNTFERLKGISFVNGSFQERIISFEDGITAITDNPKGYGINNYLYEITSYKTADYGIRYIHNSILHITFEIGVIGGIIFSIYIIYSIYILYKKKISEELLVYILCIGHSLIDFDFQHATFIVIIMMVLGMNIDNNKEVKINKVAIGGGIVIVSVILINELILGIGRLFWINGEIDSAKNFTKSAYIKDWRYYYISADYEMRYEVKEELFEKAVKEKNKALLKYKMVSMYKEKEYKKYKQGMLNLEESYKYSINYYKEFYRMAKKKNDSEGIEKIKEIHRRAKLSVNKRAKYLPKQINQD